MHIIYKGIQQTGIFGVGAGTFIYLYHKCHHNSSLWAEAAECDKNTLPVYETKPVQGQAAVPTQIAQEGPLVLELKQVQVLFRHGARVPLYLVPKVNEANYESQYIMREHQASLFPYQRLQWGTGQQVEWPEVQMNAAETSLKSGTYHGNLTAYGKDQMYTMGKNLQKCYMDSLNLATYDPNEVFVLSSNIKRTVESLRCVLAGFFGKEQLKAFAEFCFPVSILVTYNDFNILLPNVDTCDVLKKVHLASMFNTDALPGFMEDRLALEMKINKERENNMDKVKEVQEKINLLCKSVNMDDDNKNTSIEYNKYHQQYLRDSIFHPLVEERSRAIDKIDRFWTNALVSNHFLSLFITENDMKALIYLRKLEVEHFRGMFTSGYRFHFHFDPNPYFHNDHLCKEVYLNRVHHEKTSWSTPIVWKKCGKGEQEAESDHDLCKCRIECQRDNSKSLSFFQWYTQMTCEKHDCIGKAIRDEVWPDPIKSSEGQRILPDKWENSFNFIAGRDDIISRKSHGLAIPEELKPFESTIISRATMMLYYMTTGVTSAERLEVTRLCAGPLFSKIIRLLDDKIKGKEQTPSLCLYSTHDSTVVAMLESLGIWNYKWPPFASDIRIELYKDVNSSEYYIRVLYCGEVQRIRGQMTDYVHWCDFKKSVLKYYICEDEYWNSCRSDVLERHAKNTYSDKTVAKVSAKV